MKRAITSALLAITLTLGCGGEAVAQAPKPKPAKARTVDPFDALAVQVFDARDNKDYKTEIELLRPLVEKGSAWAETMLGDLYLEGTGVPQDYKEAARLYRLSAAQGNSWAQDNLGRLYSGGDKGIAQDYKEALRLFHLSASQGNADAQVFLGFHYQLGQGIPQDYVRAHMWFNLGAALLSGEKSKKASDIRDLLAKEMTPAQIAEAQTMARKCQASNFKQCD